MADERVELGVSEAPPRGPGRLWLQLLVVFLLALAAQAIGLVFAYFNRCKPGQGNDWCGLGSVAGVAIGFAAAVCIVIAGVVMILVRRRNRSGGGRVGAGRYVAAIFGAIVFVPCAWMIGVGWPRNNSNLALWLGIALGVGLLAIGFRRKRNA